MQQRLPDIERTLLSAYIDGELSASERQDVERLLESSDGARAYLRELRADNIAAGEAFPALPAGIASAGAMGSGKLTAAAIRSAAMKGTIGNGSLSGIWSMSGLATAAALVVAGFNYLSMPAGSPITEPIAPAPQITRVAPAPVRPLPVLDVDTSSFIIPAMTRSELIDFAVQGTLPIDEKRNCFITVTQNSDDALAVSVHPAADVSHARIVDDIVNAGTHRLDSVHQIVRTALIPYAKNSIAVRSDLPMLRLQVLEELAESAERIPPQVRKELERVRIELRDAGREAEHAREVLLSSRGGIDAGGGAGTTRAVLYIPIESEGMRRFTSSQWTQAPTPETFTLIYNRCQVVGVDPGLLEAASNAAYATAMEERQERKRIETRVVSSPGDPTAAPIRRTRGNTVTVVNGAPSPPAMPSPPVAPNTYNRIPSSESRPVTQDELDDLLKNAEKSLKKARESLRRAQELQKKQESNGGDNSDDGDSNGDQ
jgi:hypothetical protein